MFDKKIEIGELCKGGCCVDLGEIFQINCYSQKSALIQPKTSPVKFARWRCSTIEPAALRKYGAMLQAARGPPRGSWRRAREDAPS